MNISKKILSVLLTLVMLLSLFPVAAFADSYVYISVSYDGQYVPNNANGGYIARVPISYDALAAVDLEAYDLGEYAYDEDGDGKADITALHLVIYAHENLYGGSWGDVTFTGAPGSSYFEGGIFGFDENLNYYLNGTYPLASAGWGATSDQIVLEAGDYLDIASFSSWDFYQDSNYGFHFFADSNGAFTHSYSGEVGTAVPVKLVRSFSAMGVEATVYDEPGFEVYYGTSLYNGTESVTTDDSGCAEITFPSAGTWYLWADGGYGNEYPDAIVSSPAYAVVTVTAEEVTVPEETRQPQDVSAVLNVTMAKLASTVTAPAFGTTAGEWTVLSLARGGYYAQDNAYFADYYNRIVETVNNTAASVNMGGALHEKKSTENSRLIAALSALGKDATSVGFWNLIEAYNANGLEWIGKQGLNGTIWALIALDSNNYETTDSTLRQQCVDAILAAQHDDGGWSLMANKTLASDPDVTGMALTALYPYRGQSGVAAACEKAIECLSVMQHENGSFASGGSECAESCAWVIVAATTWGINPDTDTRFIKNGNSVVDALLDHYMEDSATFQHIIGAGSNAMATDQACYALVAYDRFVEGGNALFDYSDVTFETVSPSTNEMAAILSVPEEIDGDAGTTFNAFVSINKWDNEAGYKLIDFILSVPDGLSVTGVTANDVLTGGSVNYNVEEQSDGSGLLRVVYFDANENSDLIVNSNAFPAQLFSIGLKVDENLTDGIELDFEIKGMSVKLNSDSVDEDSMVIVNTTASDTSIGGGGSGTTGGGSTGVVTGVSYSAVCLYTGDDVDLIPSTKKAVAVMATGISQGAKLTYKEGDNEIEFLYSPEISNKSGVYTYVALVDAAINMENFVNKTYVKYDASKKADTITFADSNGDGTVNAQDALDAVNAWLRKGDALTDTGILTLNVNGDSRINTFDALGIVEAFVNSAEYGIVTKAATARN